MPVPVLSPLDFNKTELLNARLQNLGVDPSGLSASDRGLMWIDGAGVIKFYDGESVQTLGLATGGNAETLDGRNAAWYRNRTNHTGSQAASTISDFDTAAATAARAAISVADTPTLDLTKSGAGAISGAVLDSPTVGGQTVAQLRNRNSHTGTQNASTISDFDESVDDRVNALIVTSGALTKNYDDAANRLTLGVDINGGDAATLGGVAASGFQRSNQKNQPNGYAGLDAQGNLPQNILPALAITETHVVATIAARNALTVQEGDVAIVTGTSQSFIYDATGEWVELISPADGVQSVNAGTGLSTTGGVNPTLSVSGGGIGTAQLADLAVTSAKLADGAVGLATAKASGTLPVSKGGTGATTAAAALNALGGTRKFSANVGNGTATEITVTHNLNTRDVQVQVFRNSGSYDQVIVDVERTTTSAVVIRFATAPANNAFRAVVVG